MGSSGDPYNVSRFKQKKQKGAWLNDFPTGNDDVAMIRDIKERAKRLEKKSRKNTIWCHQHAEYKTFAKWFDIKLVELKAALSIPGTGVGIPAVLAAVGPPAVLPQAAV